MQLCQQLATKSVCPAGVLAIKTSENVRFFILVTVQLECINESINCTVLLLSVLVLVLLITDEGNQACYPIKYKI